MQHKRTLELKYNQISLKNSIPMFNSKGKKCELLFRFLFSFNGSFHITFQTMHNFINDPFWMKENK